jgi:LysM repeat protein
MKARRWVLFIGLNIVVSVVTTLVVLSLREELGPVTVVTPSPGALVLGRAPTPTSASASIAPTAINPEPAVEAIQPTPGEPSQYTIQQGDTLGGIALLHGISLQNLLLANNLAEDEFIQPGQVLIIPAGQVVTPTPPTPSAVPETPTPSTPTPFPSATPTPPGPVEVRIKEILAAGNLAREGVVLINRGRTVNLYGWTLSAAGTDEATDEAYVFPRLTLAQEVPVTVYTMAGENTPQALHWGLDEALWVTPGMNVELRDADGDLVATFAVP